MQSPLTRILQHLPRMNSHRLWLVCGLLVLALIRLALLHSNPSDFPQDRNTTVGALAQQMIHDTPLTLNIFRLVRELSISTPLLPEYPVIAIWSWFWGHVGVNVLLAGRIFSLLMGIVCGLAIYRLGTRHFSRPVGLIALWLFALIPMAVLVGRAYINESFMLACLLAAMVVAGRPVNNRWDWPLALALLLLTLAGLAKLQALAWLPVVALISLHHRNWRGRGPWVYWIFGSVFIYLVMCFWYHLPLLNPGAGIAQIQKNIHTVVDPWAIRFSKSHLLAALNLTILGLTLPGMILTFAGVFSWRPRLDQAWVPFMLLIGLVYCWYFQWQNEYYACVLVPPGVILMGHVLERMWNHSRLMLAALVVCSLPLLHDRPELRKISYLFMVKPTQHSLEQDRLKFPEKVLYDSWLWQEPTYYTGVKGDPAPNFQPESIVTEATKYGYQSYLTIFPVLKGNTEALFRQKPITAARNDDYALFDLRPAARIGDLISQPRGIPVQNPRAIHGWEVKAITPARTTCTGGEDLELAVELVRPAHSAVQPALILIFIHEPTGEVLMPSPRAGGLYAIGARLPTYQLPSQPGLHRMVYRVGLDPLLPTGRYMPAVALVTDEKYAAPSSRIVGTLPFEVQRPTAAASAKLQIDLRTDANWVYARDVQTPAWFGQQPRPALLDGNSCRFSPNLPAGRYRLKVRARSHVAGTAGDLEPRLLVRTGINDNSSEHTFFGYGFETRSFEITWGGPTDLIEMCLANPYSQDPPRPEEFPLRGDTTIPGTKVLEIGAVSIVPAE